MKGQVVIFSRRQEHLDALAMVAATAAQFDSVISCSSAEKLFTLLDEKRLDLILTSAGADPDRDLDWLKTVAKRDAWRDTPVIVFTDGDDGETRIRALEQGAADALSFTAAAREIAARIALRLHHLDELRKLRKARNDLARLALTDSLTGLCNRAFFDVTLESEAARSLRTGQPYALLLLDVDHFKWINDTYGHQLGDTVLQAIARVLKHTVRKSDMACRYGGEEFALVLPATAIPSAQILAQRIHQEIAELARQYGHFRQPLTVSIGISCGSGGESDPALVVEQADCALYAAKRKGRNRTEVFHLDSREEFARTDDEDTRPASNLRM